MSDNQEFVDQGQRKYFSLIPNIIFEILKNPFDFKVYCYINRVAGTNSSCYKSVATAANECGMSERQFQDSKKFLSQPFKELNNKPLIQITKRLNESGGNQTDIITLIDIMPENIQKFSTGAQHAPPPVQDMHPPGAQYAPKEEPLPKKNQKERNVNARTREAVPFDVKENLEVKRNILDSLVFEDSSKLKKETIHEWLEQYSLEDICRSIAVFDSNYRNGIEIDNPEAFLQSALSKKWDVKDRDVRFCKLWAMQFSEINPSLVVKDKYVIDESLGRDLPLDKFPAALFAVKLNDFYRTKEWDAKHVQE